MQVLFGDGGGSGDPQMVNGGVRTPAQRQRDIDQTVQRTSLDRYKCDFSRETKLPRPHGKLDRNSVPSGRGIERNDNEKTKTTRIYCTGTT